VSLIRENGTPALFDEPLVRETIAPADPRRAQMYETRKREGAPGRPVFDAINVRKLHAAGVRQVLGSDAPARQPLARAAHAPGVRHGRGGLHPDGDDRPATRDSAKVLRLDQLGMVAAGKSADSSCSTPSLDRHCNVRKINAVTQRRGRRSRRIAGEMAAQWREKGSDR